VLSSELESCLNQAFQQARGARHEFVTVEHLLLAILDVPTVRDVKSMTPSVRGQPSRGEQLAAESHVDSCVFFTTVFT
jgi:ATP-dependent Clp protease ATP-binding subunit ClpA